MGMAVDAALFRWTEAHADRLARGDAAALAGAVARAIRAKARVVRADERECANGPRTALNYGHTLGHALEAAHGYRGLLHGEAVALGMRAAAVLSRRWPDVPLARVFDAMARDKKRDARGVRWVLTTRIGHASVPRLIPQGLVRAACRDIGAPARARTPRRDSTAAARIPNATASPCSSPR